MHSGDTFEVVLSHDVPEGSTIAFFEGRTWFIRHGITGERVRVRVTEVKDRMGRADVVEVLDPSPHRVAPPCMYAGRCGGCDYQHIDLGEQRRVKSSVLRDALRRQGGFIDPPTFPVMPVPGDEHGLRWRTRMKWHVDEDGRRGLRKHRSHEVVPIDDCLIARTDATEVVEEDFGQAHAGLTALLRDRIQALGRPAPGEVWWDLFGGSGALSTQIAVAVGPNGRVDLVDASRVSAQRARTRAEAQVRVHCAKVESWVRRAGRVDGIVVDPPRTGLKPSTIGQLARREPRIIISISCHPVSFARDLAVFREHGYDICDVEAYDAYPMTWHMELLAALVQRGRTDRIALR